MTVLRLKKPVTMSLPSIEEEIGPVVQFHGMTRHELHGPQQEEELNYAQIDEIVNNYLSLGWGKGAVVASLNVKIGRMQLKDAANWGMVVALKRYQAKEELFFHPFRIMWNHLNQSTWEHPKELILISAAPSDLVVNEAINDAMAKVKT